MMEKIQRPNKLIEHVLEGLVLVYIKPSGEGKIEMLIRWVPQFNTGIANIQVVLSSEHSPSELH